MTAFAMVGSSSGTLAIFLGLALVMALGVLLPHLGAYRPKKAKKVIAGALVALSLATVAAPAVKAEDEDPGIVIVDSCKNLTPSDPMYWFLGCFWPI